MRKFKISLTTRRWLVCLHVAFIATFIGAIAINLLLSITAANAGDGALLEAAYTSMDTIARLKVVYVVAIGSLLSGMVLSIVTQWGRLRPDKKKGSDSAITADVGALLFM